MHPAMFQLVVSLYFPYSSLSNALPAVVGTHASEAFSATG
jgi:hypothetical protein